MNEYLYYVIDCDNVIKIGDIKVIIRKKISVKIHININGKVPTSLIPKRKLKKKTYQDITINVFYNLIFILL